MNGASKRVQSAIVVGGGIGGLAAALALARRGIAVDLLEAAKEIREIGAGIQLAANAFNALDALGVGEATRKRSVFTDKLLLMDALDTHEVASIDVGAAYRKRFGNPYAVIHRADVHLSILEAVRDNPLVRIHTNAQVRALNQDDDRASVVDQTGRRFQADIVIGCDGVKSIVREVMVGDQHRVTGHVVYRAVVDVEQMPPELQINAPVVWAGPDCHLVHYPLRDGRQYNLVVTFHSRQEETWGVTDGSRDEVLSYFEAIHPLPHQMLDRPTSWRRWATADRDPIETWTVGRITLLGDAAHPMTQYLAQGACQALEDAVTLGAAIQRADGDYVAAFELYQKVRIPRTARVLYSARQMGRIYHARGVERLVRNELWINRSQQQFYDAIEWLHGWRAEECFKSVLS